MGGDDRDGAGREIDAMIAGVRDWRGQTLARLRALIRSASADVVETVKWRKPTNPAGVPVWEAADGGVLITGGVFRGKVKLTFAKGARLPDPAGVFNASLDAGTTRAIDLGEGETVDAAAFQDLVRAAVAETRRKAARVGEGAA